MLPHSLLTSLGLPLLASAHFHMLYPTPRSDVDETEAQGPCGGFTVSDNRTMVALNSFAVALEMGHDRTVVQMLLAVGNTPGNNFNITLEQTFQQQGEGDFCLPNVRVPASAAIADGTNGTLQVVTDGEGGGGLYICADITFSNTQGALPSSCANGTGVTASPLPNVINANESTADGSPQNGGSASSASGSATPSSTASGSSSTESSQAMMFTAGWGVLGGAVIAALALM